MSAIMIKNLSFSYEGGDELFSRVTLNLDTSWRLGLTGRNGRGKTTLLKLLSGELTGYTGSISGLAGSRRFPYTVVNPAAPFCDIAEELEPDVPFWRLTAEADKTGVNAEALFRPYCTLSGGEQTKLMLALLFSADAPFYLIDEPTDHLDAEGRKAVARYLKKQSGFILVSHDRALLDECTTHTLAINRTGIALNHGTVSTYLINKERREQDERAENEALSRDIKRLSAAAKRTAGWADKVEKSKTGIVDYGNVKPDRGHVGRMSAKMMKRAKVIERRFEKKIEEKTALLKDVEKTETVTLQVEPIRQDLLLSIKNVSLSFSDTPLLRDLSFSLRRGERLNISGANGSGKTTLLKLILGELKPDSGTIVKASGLKIAYVPQQIGEMTGTLGDLEAQHGVDATMLRTILRKLGFNRELFSVPVSDYSLGQKKLLMLGLAAASDAHMYIFDELLNYLDLYARRQIESLLTASAAAMLFIEHDATFCTAVATRVITMSNEG